jgi:hypothetical protein
MTEGQHMHLSSANRANVIGPRPLAVLILRNLAVRYLVRARLRKYLPEALMFHGLHCPCSSPKWASNCFPFK